MKNFFLSFLTCVSALTFLSVSASAWDDYSGWWYQASESGTGMSIEIQGDTMFVAFYDYDFEGQPVWYSGGLMRSSSDPQHFEGSLSCWSGWPFTQDSSGAQPKECGSASISFSSEEHGEVSLTRDFVSRPVSFEIEKFMTGMSYHGLASGDINGWWWDPLRDGSGYFLEVRGGVAFLAWYHYDATGLEPRWTSCFGDWSSSGFSCELTYWRDGTPMAIGEYLTPRSQEIAELRVNVTEDGLSISSNGRKFVLQRFRFDPMLEPADRETNVESYCNSEHVFSTQWGIAIENPTGVTPYRDIMIADLSDGEVDPKSFSIISGTFSVDDDDNVEIHLERDGCQIDLYGKLFSMSYVGGNKVVFCGEEREVKWTAVKNWTCHEEDLAGAAYHFILPWEDPTNLVFLADGTCTDSLLGTADYVLNGDALFIHKDGLGGFSFYGYKLGADSFFGVIKKAGTVSDAILVRDSFTDLSDDLEHSVLDDIDFTP